MLGRKKKEYLALVSLITCRRFTRLRAALRAEGPDMPALTEPRGCDDSCQPRAIYGGGGGIVARVALFRKRSPQFFGAPGRGGSPVFS